jgi:hypothetical protein
MAIEIDGTYMDRSLSNFIQACELCIAREHEKLSPDMDLIALLCDAVRLACEMAEKDRAMSALVRKVLMHEVLEKKP